MPISRDDAVKIARHRLDEMATEINSHGSALPGHADRTLIDLVVTIEEEFDDGWVFAFNSRAFVEDGETGAMLAGNYHFSSPERMEQSTRQPTKSTVTTSINSRNEDGLYQTLANRLTRFRVEFYRDYQPQPTVNARLPSGGWCAHDVRLRNDASNIHRTSTCDERTLPR
ncbi:MAG: YrhB domain-containing protein [Verrucomicrobiales bacterium]